MNERNVTKSGNTLTKKVLMAYNELQRAKHLLADLSDSLHKAMEDSNCDLADCIGKYAREMPRFNILLEQANMLKTAIRKVVNREISFEVALQKTEALEKMVDEALSMFDATVIKKYQDQ